MIGIESSLVAQWVKDLTLSLQQLRWHLLWPAVRRVQSLAQEFPYATDTVKKNIGMGFVPLTTTLLRL